MVDGKMERAELRGFLTHLFATLRGSLETVRGSLADNENDCPNNEVLECLTEMATVARELESKVKFDIRLKDTKTCQQCRAEFNNPGYATDYCSDTCQREYDEELGAEDDCS